MNKKRLLAITVICILYSACTGSNKKEAQKPVQPNNEEDYINYTALLNDQVRAVDSTPLAIYKYTTAENGKTDTTTIQREEFRTLAKTFLEPDIMQRALRKDYSASTFGDKTTQLANFTYETKKPEHAVQRLNLRFKPGAFSRFTSLDMVKNLPGNTGATQKLFWKANRYFHIITDLGNNRFSKVEVVWNLSPSEQEVQ